MRILIIVNDRSGGSDAGLYDFVRVLGLGGHEVVIRFLVEATTLEDLCSDCSDFDCVVGAGGDGTVSSLVYALRHSGVPVLPFPAGTANLIALNLKMPTDPVQLARVVTDGRPVTFDLGEIEHRREDGTHACTGFSIMAGAGYDATIMERAQPLKSAMGAAAYLVGAVSNLAPTTSHFELVVDGERVTSDGIAVLVVNFARIQFDLAVTHGSDPRDGLLEVAVVRSRNVAELVPVVVGAMLDVAGEHPGRGGGLDVYRGRQIEVNADPALRMQYDGEVAESLTPFSARILPRAATFLVPADSEYAEPDAE